MKTLRKLAIVLAFLIIAGAAVVSAAKKQGNPPEMSGQTSVEEYSNSTDPANAELYPGDGEKTVEAFAAANGLSLSDYPESLIDLLSRNPETKDFVLSYPMEHDTPHTIDLSDCVNTGKVPLLMQWDKRWGYMTYGDDVAALTACGPVCLSMAALYVTGDAKMSPDKMIEFAIDEGYCVYGNGSAWALIGEGGEKLGLDVTELPLVESRIIDNLKVGNPVICVMGPGDFTATGHFIVMTGYEDGKIKINDPNSIERSEKLWEYDDICDQIQNLWAIR